MMETKNYFKELYDINVTDKIEKKNGLSYLAWAYAWAEIKKSHPSAYYTIYENIDGWNYHTDGKTCWVKTGVTVNDLEHIEYLPVMDNRNSSILKEKVTSVDVNKAIQRSLTKACARHGLGLRIYAGEDLPESSEPDINNKEKSQDKPVNTKTPSNYEIVAKRINGTTITKDIIAQMVLQNYGAGVKVNDLTGEQFEKFLKRIDSITGGV